MSGRPLLLLLAIYAGLMCLHLGDRPVTRAQEARVLETARQMIDATPRERLLPSLNGEPRLRKPPLTYWYTLASYELFGTVNTFVGRLPTLLLGLATIVVTWKLARDLGGDRVAFFGAAILASGTLFIRFVQSAETDTPAMLGVVVAQWVILRGDRGRLAWFWLAALGIALAGLSKGGPAAFPVAFVGLLAIAQRSWRPIRRFVISGAPLLAIALIAPWFVLVHNAAGGEQVGQEVSVLVRGSNHFGLFYEYLPPLIVGLLPWTPIFAIAAWFAWKGRRELGDVRRTAIAMYFSVGLPLACVFNVQPHYLLPLLPAAAIFVADWIVRTIDAEPTRERLLRGLAIAAVISMPPIVDLGTRLTTNDLGPAVARARSDLHAALGDEPDAFAQLGTDNDVSLSFYLRSKLPLVKDDKLPAFLASHERPVVVIEREAKQPATRPASDDLRLVSSQTVGKTAIDFYVRR